jgi:hypothetical protein
MNDLKRLKEMLNNSTLLEKATFLFWLPIIGLFAFMSITREIILGTREIILGLGNLFSGGKE